MRGPDASLPEATVVSRARRQVRLAAGLLLAFLAASVLAGWFSEGVYHEDDLQHYLIARWVGHDARYLLDTWGRPGFTVPCSLVAWVGGSGDGLRLARVLSALMSAATAWLVFCVARRLDVRHAWAAIPLLYLQPLFARLSSTTLTETPLALYFALATWLLVIGRPGLSAAVIALGPVTREEAVVILPLWALAMSRQHARWWMYPLLMWAIVAHNLLAGLWLGICPASRWVQPAGADYYGAGTPLTFIPRLLLASGPLIVCLTIVGAWQIRRRPWGWLLILAASTWFAAETAIYMRGAYSSGGYARFLVPICPWLAVAATAGLRPLLAFRAAGHRPLGILLLGMVGAWGLCEAEWRWRNPVIPDAARTWMLSGRVAAAVLCAIALALAVVLIRARRRVNVAPVIVRAGRGVVAAMLALGLLAFIPLRLTPFQARVRDASMLVAGLGGDKRPVLSLNRWIYYWTDRWVPWNPITDLRQWLDRADPGTLFVWDRRFCTEPVPNLSYAEMCARGDWRAVGPTLGPRVDDAPDLAFFERRPAIRASAGAARIHGGHVAQPPPAG